ncbi:MAG: LytR C-terminal domain-containing protein [Actinomycetota bacterium]
MSTTAPSRAVRSDGRRRRTQRIAAIGAIAVVASVVVWRLGRDEPAAIVTPSATVTPGRSALLVFAVTGGAEAHVAVIGSGGGRDPAAVVLAPELTVVAPGQGDRTIEALAEGDGAALRAAVSNGIGVWASRYGVMDLDGLGAVVERGGGLTVDLPDAYPLGAAVLGPGETSMDARQVMALLAEPSNDGTLRFLAVLQALLAGGPAVQQIDFAQSDDATGAAAILGTARGATVEVAPTEIFAGTIEIPAQPAFDDLMASLFGATPPVRVIVQNGSGRPGVGQAVAERLLPAGFRIVISENAETFDHAQTEITAHGTEHESDAVLAQQSLGVGSVVVSEVASGFADVTIVVGKDFTR